MEIRQANANEYERVRAFYYELIDKMRGSTYHPMWEKGIYPTDAYLEASVKAGEMFLGREDERIIGAMVLNHTCNEAYTKVKWETDAAEDEVTIIHTLCILPECAGKGYGTQLVEFARKYALEKGQKALRLDVLKGNLPAEQLYTRMGFKRLETIQMYYDDTGWTDFILYELALVPDAHE